MLFYLSELLLILNVLANISKVNPTCCFPRRHHIQSARFNGIEVNAPGKHSPSVIMETDHEFRREILIWQSLLPKPFLVFLPSVSSCIFNLTAAPYWRWQAFLKPACLLPRIGSFITKRRFYKLVTCVGKGRKTPKKKKKKLTWKNWSLRSKGTQWSRGGLPGSRWQSVCGNRGEQKASYSGTVKHSRCSLRSWRRQLQSSAVRLSVIF